MKNRNYEVIENNITYYVTESYYPEKNYKLIYYYNDKFKKNIHRENNPAILTINYKTNEILVEAFIQNNLVHRIDGPARIEYGYTKKPRKSYWVNGKELRKVKSTKQLLRYIKLNNLT